MFKSDIAPIPTTVGKLGSTTNSIGTPSSDTSNLPNSSLSAIDITTTMSDSTLLPETSKMLVKRLIISLPTGIFSGPIRLRSAPESQYTSPRPATSTCAILGRNPQCTCSTGPIQLKLRPGALYEVLTPPLRPVGPRPRPRKLPLPPLPRPLFIALTSSVSSVSGSASSSAVVSASSGVSSTVSIVSSIISTISPFSSSKYRGVIFSSSSSSSSWTSDTMLPARSNRFRRFTARSCAGDFVYVTLADGFVLFFVEGQNLDICPNRLQE